jgi:Peptidase propeptide and YPEB domain.
MNTNKIKKVLDSGLNAHAFTKEDQQAVFSKLAAPKRSAFRLKPVLILAFVLALALATAGVANTLIFRDAVQEVVQAKNETGFLLTWTDADKLRFVQLMRENGIEFPEGDGAIHRESWWTAENALGDAVEIAFGDVRFCSLEDQLYVQQLFKECGIISKGASAVVLPKDGDMPQEEALIVAKAALKELADITEEALAKYELSVFHGTIGFEKDCTWEFQFFADRSEPEAVCGVRISEKTRTVVDIWWKGMLIPEGKEQDHSNQFPVFDYTISPQPEDMTAEKALELSCKTLKETYALPDEYIASLIRSEATFFGFDGVPAWRITLTDPNDNGHNKYFMITLDAKTGDILDIRDPNTGWG